MFLFHKKKKSRIVPIFFGSCLIIGIVVVFGAWYISHTVSTMNILNTDIVRNTVVKELGEGNAFLYDLVPVFLGFSEPQTYLVLFLNNTELRPGGGFIGTYATIRVDKGSIQILALDGTENLDRNAPATWHQEPPLPIQTYLGLDRWFFRDSNWSPDFRESAERALAFYTAEGGIGAEDIDGVIGITATVLEALLRVVGPVTVEGITFTDENIIETLEYQVEYGYKEQGIHITDRKKIMHPLFLAILETLKVHILSEYKTYLSLAETVSNERHLLLYHTDAQVQKILEAHDWAGRVAITTGDYLLWVDANLGALKTDVVMRRSLRYEMLGKEENRYKVRTTMTYDHTGQFDWRTSRYITYARVFVPEGSELFDVSGTLKSGSKITREMVERGVEGGKTWFGTMFSIEPQQVKKLSFTYVLPESVVRDSIYSLVVQKQLGSIDHALTLDLDFATLLQSADPPEEQEEWYDGVYRYTTDLREDRSFVITL